MTVTVHTDYVHPLSRPGGEVVFHGLDDFHPDRLYARLPMLQGLREARDNPGTADEALQTAGVGESG